MVHVRPSQVLQPPLDSTRSTGATTELKACNGIACKEEHQEGAKRDQMRVTGSDRTRNGHSCIDAESKSVAVECQLADQLDALYQSMLIDVQRVQKLIDLVPFLAAGDVQTMARADSSMVRADSVTTGTSVASPSQGYQVAEEVRKSRFFAIIQEQPSWSAASESNDSKANDNDYGKGESMRHMNSSVKFRDCVTKQFSKRVQQQKFAETQTWWTKNIQDKEHQRFLMDTFMTFVVILNALVIGVSCDYGSDDFWVPIDTMFAGIFLAETVMKVKMAGCRDFFFGSEGSWNIFELVLLFAALGEVVFALVRSNLLSDVLNLSILRVVRLIRITRIFRVLRLQMFADLKAMITGTRGGLRTLLWSVVLIFWPLYTCCLVLRATLGEGAVTGVQDFGAEHFSSVPEALFTLFRCVVVGECTDVQGRPVFVLIAQEHGWFYSFLYSALTLFMQFGLFNVLVALYVENVVAAAKSNDQILKKNRLRDAEYFNGKMYDLISLCWDAYCRSQRQLNWSTSNLSNDTTIAKCIEHMSSMVITPDLFEEVRQTPEAQEIFADLDVAELDQYSLFDMLDVDGSGTLEVFELQEGIAKLRGEARRSDMVSLQMLLRKMYEEFRHSRHN